MEKKNEQEIEKNLRKISSEIFNNKRAVRRQREYTDCIQKSRSSFQSNHGQTKDSQKFL